MNKTFCISNLTQYPSKSADFRSIKCMLNAFLYAAYSFTLFCVLFKRDQTESQSLYDDILTRVNGKNSAYLLFKN